MKSVDLNAKWKITSGDDVSVCDLPYDATVNIAKDYACAFGERNGYRPDAAVSMAKDIPTVKSGKTTLYISGACGRGDVMLNGELVGRLDGYAPHSFDLTGRLSGLRNTLALQMVSSAQMSDKYVGLGIAGGVKLFTQNKLDFECDSLFVKTETADGKTYAVVSVTVRNDGEAVKFTLDCSVANARGKRAGKKQRKIFMRASSVKTFVVRVRITKAYEWTVNDPYMYRLTAKIIAPDNAERAVSTSFGIVTRMLNVERGLYINGKNTLLMGAYVSHADAALGGVCNYSNEKRRFTALKNIGYNAVHFVECPAEAALDALDDIGMYAFVDLFAHLRAGKSPLDGHELFTDGMSCTEASVRALRNHPCVVMYGVADDVPECYGRHGGHKLIADIAERIRETDDTRPITVSAREEVPTVKELEEAGVRKIGDTAAALINAGREKDLFDTLTAGAFDSVDVCGFNYLYPLYETEKFKRNRLIVGARTSTDRAFESLDETEKNGRVIGDFNDCGIDYPGGGKLNEIITTRGDLDAMCDEKPQSVYKRILLGARDVVYITVLDPDTDEPVSMWNWPRHLGREVTVKVYTSGVVVALYLDGRLIGRKLAGKLNRHVATFTTEYYPGTLEAVAYFKGVECARTTLKTAGSPKSIKLSAYEKNLSIERGDLGFLYVDVCDKEGEIVPYAMRELEITVTDGKLLGFINADPMLRKNAFDRCPAYGGKAFAVIKPDGEGKTVVKVTGDGLTSSKLTFKARD